MRHRVSKKEFMTLFFGAILLVLISGISAIVFLTYAGMISILKSLKILD